MHFSLRCTIIYNSKWLYLFQVDTILDKENFKLEDLLDEDEIIQECKALNTRLINLYSFYFLIALYILVVLFLD
jgi:hypothetical protein